LIRVLDKYGIDGITITINASEESLFYDYDKMLDDMLEIEEKLIFNLPK